VVTAMIGSAVRLIREPNALIACAAHSRRPGRDFLPSSSMLAP